MAKGAKKSKIIHEKEGVTTPNFISKKVAQSIQQHRGTKVSAKTLAAKILKGNRTALSQGITLIESTAQKHQQEGEHLIEACLPSANKSIRIGITGVPGVGKSSFIECLGTLLTGLGKKVAILAVDPSSTVSKGSILGDKTRMASLVTNRNAYIRPSASGNSLGGVARKTREAIILCEAAGFDTIIIETVGVGQSETAVHSMTDFFLLLKLAGAGDELQGIKRGIMEMADAIAINKADGENVKAAKLAKAEFNRALHLYPPKDNGWVPKTVVCSALENQGIEEIWELVSNYISEAKNTNYFQNKRNKQNKFWLLQTIDEQLKRNFYENDAVKEALTLQTKLVEAGKITPFKAAENLLAFI
ncbi:methylmalonyl Co-A mutase-associated GTPase MeaB [Rasiella rasia]|uniref:Methylmalonyl Co-A mutase-associated GTPase MeaB n=1 Tax=Rasiella rasia TaxID=2744027 RepID=A0A6G6GPW1_9FLAO|nr:methylmalonyl Co-A mutase-associated GTPase MeaB [Rasiella rasia]QIE60588.1 methylmalonyl Co-A mutase-associated GTPase MeaB [Rasiella rasia]